MKRGSKLTLGAAAVLALGLGGLAATSYAHERGAGRGGGMGMMNHGGGMGMMNHGGGMGMGGGHRMRMFEMLDTDKDGAVGGEEARAAMLEQLKKFDADSDGNLSLDEFAAMWAAHMRPMMVDRFQFHDDDGDGSVTPEELTAPFARMMRRMDKNGDGKIGPDDMQRHGGGEGTRGKGKHGN